MTAGLTCEVYTDKARLADTGDEYEAATPTALAGLTVVWGRATTVDQPAPSTCSFTVADKDGDADFLGRLHVGHVVDVYAAGAVTSGTTPVDVVVDGSFEQTKPSGRVYTVDATASVDTAAAVGNKALGVMPLVQIGTGGTVAIPPAPWSSNPDAWTPIPKVAAGQTWTVTVQVALGGGATATLYPAVYATPTAGLPTRQGPFVQLQATGNLQWRTVTLVWTIPAGVTGWLGAEVALAAAVTWAQATGTWAAQTLTWRDLTYTRIDDMHVLAPPSASSRVLVFSGRITDLVARPAVEGVAVDVTATDLYADLANDYLNPGPWAAETIAARVARIVGLAATPVAVDVSTWPGGRLVSWVDVDNAPVAGLLAELATSADAVLWPVFGAARGFYLWMEDTALRQQLGTFILDAGSGKIIISTPPRPADAVSMSACDVGRDGVQWTQDVTDIASIVDVSWQAQTTDGGGQPSPTEMHVVQTDPAAFDEFGTRRLASATILANAADAVTVAGRLFNRTTDLGWRVTGIVWDTDLPAAFGDADRATALAILDGTRRIGLPLILEDLPAWTPGDAAPATYVEGGTYTYEGGRWALNLTLSPAGKTASGNAIKWRDVNAAYRWSDMSPSVTWLDCYTVQKG